MTLAKLRQTAKMKASARRRSIARIALSTGEPMLSRRTFLGGLAALGAAGTAAAQAQKKTPAALPARGELVIRNAYVMTMDAAGDIADADVHVRNGAIVAVG